MVGDLLGKDFPFSEGVLSGNIALVCGASEGIGRATSLFLARAGAQVIACARSEGKLDDLINNLHGHGHQALPLDLEDTEQVERTISKLSSTGVEILINNSGGPPGSPLIENEIGDFEGPLRRHLYASHLFVKGLLPNMEKSNFGRIVNIISTSVKEPVDGIGLSNTLRGAMASWSKSLSNELPPYVTINNILPGYTDTGRLVSLSKSKSDRTGLTVEEVYSDWMGQAPIKRLVDPLETASAVVWLCLPSSGAIRGVSLAVDGGRMRSI